LIEGKSIDFQNIFMSSSKGFSVQIVQQVTIKYGLLGIGFTMIYPPWFLAIRCSISCPLAISDTGDLSADVNPRLVLKNTPVAVNRNYSNILVTTNFYI
jgi:hypothetical protein